MKQYNVLSLFDGCSGAYMALTKAGKKVGKYYASEIDKFAIKAAKLINPSTIHLGDITKWKEWDIEWKSIDLIAAGSPCQGFSFAGKQLAFDDPRSKLFFEFINILNHVRKFNPDVKFFLENVIMKKEHMRVINEYTWVIGQRLNSALVSAQNRDRMYWSNISTIQVGLFSETHTYIEPPKDRGILLKDILQPESEVDDKYYLSDATINRINRKNYSQPKINPDKTGTLNAKNNSWCMSIDSETTFIGIDINKKAPTQRNSTGRCLDDKHNYQIIRKPIVNDKGLLKSCIKSNCVDANYHKGLDNHAQRTFICVAMRGRNPENPNDRKTGSPTEQRLEAKTDGKTNCITSVQKDNLVFIGGYKNGEIIEGNSHDFSQGARIYSPEGKSVSLSLGGGLGGSTGIYKTDYCLRRLTPLECMRLQTIPELFQKILLESGISDTQLYKMMGNGWNIDTVELYYREL